MIKLPKQSKLNELRAKCFRAARPRMALSTPRGIFITDDLLNEILDVVQWAIDLRGKQILFAERVKNVDDSIRQKERDDRKRAQQELGRKGGLTRAANAEAMAEG